MIRAWMVLKKLICLTSEEETQLDEFNDSEQRIEKFK